MINVNSYWVTMSKVKKQKRAKYKSGVLLVCIHKLAADLKRVDL